MAVQAAMPSSAAVSLFAHCCHSRVSGWPAAGAMTPSKSIAVPQMRA